MVEGRAPDDDQRTEMTIETALMLGRSPVSQVTRQPALESSPELRTRWDFHQSVADWFYKTGEVVLCSASWRR
jgi:hypothetical protein